MHEVKAGKAKTAATETTCMNYPVSPFHPEGAECRFGLYSSLSENILLGQLGLQILLPTPLGGSPTHPEKLSLRVHDSQGPNN